MINLKKVDGNNIWDILKLRVNDSQKEFVASNDISIIEAYIADKYNGVAYPYLYKSFGFIETGDKDGEELIAILEL